MPSSTTFISTTPVSAGASTSRPSPGSTAGRRLRRMPVFGPRCPDCGGPLAFGEGCRLCPVCGHSSCA